MDATSKHNINSDANTSFIAEEKLHPSGFSAGGEGVNRAFEAALTQVLGSDFIQRFQKSKHPLLLDLMKEFEVKKKAYGGDNTIQLGSSFILGVRSVYQAWASAGKSKQNRLVDFFEEKLSSAGLVFDEFRGLHLPTQFVNDLFHDTVTAIADFVRNQIAPGEIDVVYLAGGFAASPYLQEKIREVVRDNAVLVMPKNPEKAVLEGAIHYSRSQRSVTTFDVDANYGVMTKSFVRATDKHLHPHIMQEGSVVLEGSVHQQEHDRDDLETENSVKIYRNEREFLEIPLQPRLNVGERGTPTVKVYLQKITTEREENVLQLTVIDQGYDVARYR